MSESRLEEILNRLEFVTKLGGILKWIVLAAFGLGGWVAVLQVQVQASKTDIAAIQLDRKEHIKASDEWHRQKDKDDATREQIIAQLAKIQDHQQSQIDAMSQRR